MTVGAHRVDDAARQGRDGDGAERDERDGGARAETVVTAGMGERLTLLGPHQLGGTGVGCLLPPQRLEPDVDRYRDADEGEHLPALRGVPRLGDHHFVLTRLDVPVAFERGTADEGPVDANVGSGDVDLDAELADFALRLARAGWWPPGARSEGDHPAPESSCLRCRAAET